MVQRTKAVKKSKIGFTSIFHSASPIADDPEALDQEVANALSVKQVLAEPTLHAFSSKHFVWLAENPRTHIYNAIRKNKFKLILGKDIKTFSVFLLTLREVDSPLLCDVHPRFLLYIESVLSRLFDESRLHRLDFAKHKQGRMMLARTFLGTMWGA